jgi:tetratricopeptide repeat protein 30
MVVLKDSVFQEILEFFDQCELYGANIPVVVDPFAPNANQSPTLQRYHSDQSFDEMNMVGTEARLLKSLYLPLYD